MKTMEIWGMLSQEGEVTIMEGIYGLVGWGCMELRDEQVQMVEGGADEEKHF